MGWSERTKVETREQFVLDALRGDVPMKTLCQAYGVSRKTGYKWLKRYKAEGAPGLLDRSRAPHSCPHKTPQELVDRIVALRKKRGWCAETLRHKLIELHPETDWPSPSTIHGIIKQHGLVTVSNRTRKDTGPTKPPNPDTDVPNDIWCVDFKGEFRMQNGAYCYPLTVLDWATRHALLCDGKLSTEQFGVQDSFQTLFETYGVPGAILSDNGLPFAHPNSTCRLSKLNVWWIKHGIELMRTVPGHPQHNPRIERFHRTLKAATTRPPGRSLAEQQHIFDVFLHSYNFDRPHLALNGECPGHRYTSSNRPFQLRPTSYPGHFEVRKVSTSGKIKLNNIPVFVTATLEGEHVGLEEFDDERWNVFFQDHLIGIIDERTGQITPLGPTPVRYNVLPMYL